MPTAKLLTRVVVVLIALFTTIVFAPTLRAEEGGASHYQPGSQGDFAMALIGPRGFYLRSDLMLLRGRIHRVTLGDRVYTSAKQTALVDVLKGIYMGGRAFRGSRWGAALSLPVVFQARASGEAAVPVAGSREGTRSGLGDVSLTPFMNWKRGDHHLTTALNIYAPTGAYSKDRMINLGRNYWSFDPTVSYTWLDSKRGHEFSAIAGFMFNTENQATEYRSGNAFHFDFTVAQRFSERLAVGLVGYGYLQATDDSGPLLDRANTVLQGLGLKRLGGFRGEAFGIGPAISYTASLGSRDVTFILKGMTDLHKKNRFQSDTIMLSVALKL